TDLEYGDEVIVIDAGVTFPDEEMPGIDLVVPDVSYLAENKEKIKAILLTHGHEDHIGGLPYLLKEIKRNTPIYATKLTHMLAENKLREHRINDSVQKVVRPGDTVKLGNFFEVEFINVTHSIAGALALAIRTPHGVIYHSGDFKIDLTPVAGDPIDLASIARIGKEGVLLLLGESTNIERPGYTMSEKVVGTTLDHLFGENVGRRLIIATFASNVHRLQQIIDLAVKYHRKVALSGRSMLNVVDAAMQIGEIKIPEGVLIDVEKTKNLFDHELVILSTGSQGEPMSALTRMAAGDFNKVTVGENDTIIISASPIPGNEKMIYRVINQLYQRGAKVVYESLESIHVSGHACIEEHKILHKLLNPKFFIPVHGEYRHLKRHAMLARDLGMSESNILIPEIGSSIELTADSIRYGEPFAGGVRLIDGMGLEDLSSSDVIKDRKRMSEEGLFIIEATVSSGFLVGEVQVIRKGFFNFQNYSYDREIAEMVEHIVDSSPDLKSEELAASVKKSVKNFLYKKTKQSPLIVPVIVEI
ncbi:MAG: ribonuclease J, partial [Christensenellaceae bacterium]